MVVIGYCVVAVVIAVVVQSHAVELFERIRNLAHGGSETRVQWNALDLRYTYVDALALLDVPEVGCLNAVALVRNDRWFRMAQQCPLCGTEERCRLDIRGASSRSKASSLILDQQLSDERLAETVVVSVM